MRTTVTLDDDLAEKLKSIARERGVSFKQALNEAVRSGVSGARRSSKPYRLKPTEMGVRPGIDLAKALRLADALEDTEIARKLEQKR